MEISKRMEQGGTGCVSRWFFEFSVLWLFLKLGIAAFHNRCLDSFVFSPPLSSTHCGLVVEINTLTRATESNASHLN